MFHKEGDLRIAVGFVIMTIAALSLALPACQKREKTAEGTRGTPPASTSAAPVVTGLELGNAIQGNKRVVQSMITFGPMDTIYASVMTDGNAPSATLTARWTFEDGQIVDESSQTITMSGPATTEFHIVKPSGWPAGKYKVEILLNGNIARSAEFTVK